PRARRLLRRAERGAPRAPAGRGDGGGRLELLRAAEQARVLPLDDLRPRRAPRLRAGARRVGRRDRRAPPRRGLPPRARPAPPAVDRAGDLSGLAALLVPDLLALRRPARPRLPARRRRGARRAHRGRGPARRGQARPRRALAARAPPPGGGPLR